MLYWMMVIALMFIAIGGLMIWYAHNEAKKQGQQRQKKKERIAREMADLQRNAEQINLQASLQQGRDNGGTLQGDDSPYTTFSSPGFSTSSSPWVSSDSSSSYSGGGGDSGGGGASGSFD